MGLWRALTDWNADELFISSDQIATTEQVRLAQIARVKEQAARGVIGPEEEAALTVRAYGVGYENLSAEESPWRTFADTATDPATLKDSLQAAGAWTSDTITGGASGLLQGLIGPAIKNLWWLILLAGVYFAWRAGLFRRLTNQ